LVWSPRSLRTILLIIIGVTPLARLLVSPIPNPGLDPVSHFVDGFDATLQFRGGTDRYTVLSTLGFIPFNEVALAAQGDGKQCRSIQCIWDAVMAACERGLLAATHWLLVPVPKPGSFSPRSVTTSPPLGVISVHSLHTSLWRQIVRHPPCRRVFAN